MALQRGLRLARGCVCQRFVNENRGDRFRSLGVRGGEEVCVRVQDRPRVVANAGA